MHKYFFSILILLATTILFQGCDKEGNPLPDGRYVEVNFKGQTYIHEGKFLSLNGAIRSPMFEYYYYNLPSYAKGVKYISLNADLHKKNTKESSEHTIQIKIPVGDEIILNHAYEIKSLPDYQFINTRVDNYSIYDEENIAYIKYNKYSYYTLLSYGSGKVYFTKITKKDIGAEDIEGTFECTIPSLDKEGTTDNMKGKFKLLLKKV